MVEILIGDVRSKIREIPDGSVQCVVTSPPYYGLRSYLDDDSPDKALEVGQEQSPIEYVTELVSIFREVRRVLTDDGVLWLNLGDSYAGNGGSGSVGKSSALLQGGRRVIQEQAKAKVHSDLPAKNLIGIPWRVALALQDDGWILRQDIIWQKKNAMPESVRDRCTRSHEYIFMLVKNQKYYYNHEAIMEDSVYKVGGSHSDVPQGGFRDKGEIPGTSQRSFRAIRDQRNKRSVWEEGDSKQDGHGRRHEGFNARYDARVAEMGVPEKRNKRSVWEVNTGGYKGAHFAVMPADLVIPCVLAGSREGDTVLDPFAGSGTVLQVARNLGREVIGIELNPEYEPLIRERLAQQVLPI